MVEREKLLAVFIDIENALPDFNSETLRYIFDHLAGIGEVALKRGYADWSKLADKKQEALEWNIATMNLFVRGQARKNAADIAITVDAIEQLYTVKEITTFVIVGGDSDLAPLATKLREKGKEVIGIARRDSASPYFIGACSGFVYLDDLEHKAEKTIIEKKGGLKTIKDKLKKIIEKKVDKTKPLSAGLLKSLLLKEEPNFKEKKYGFKTFTQLLESFLEFTIIRSATGSANIKLMGEEKIVPELKIEGAMEPTAPLSLEEAQDVLIRAIKSSRKPDGYVDAAALKSTMLRIAPHFSEKPLGYSKFTDFIADQKDFVKMNRISPGKYAIELLEK